MIPLWPAPYGHGAGGSELPYNLRTVAELECEPEWVGALYLGEPRFHERTWEPGDGPLPPVPEEWYPPDAVPLEPIELVPGGGVSPTGAPGTHQDADGAVATGDGCDAAPSVQTPPSLPVDATGWGRGGGPDVVLWAATLTALVITTVYALARVAQWHLIGGG